MKRITVTVTRSFVFDPERVATLLAQVAPDPNEYGEDEYAVLSYLGTDSPYAADVFEDQGDYDVGYEISDYDEEA